MKPYHLNAQKQFNNVSNKPKLYVSFEEYNDQSIEIDIAPVSFVFVIILIYMNHACFCKSMYVIK